MRTRIWSTQAVKRLIDVGLLVNYHTFKCARSTLQNVITDDDQVCCSSNTLINWSDMVLGSHTINTPEMIYCHDPRTHKICGNVCSELCSELYPYQTCSYVCGPAVIVGMCVSIFARKEFRSLTNGDKNPFSHLREISKFSKHIRYVIIDRLMTRKIDINLLAIVIEVTTCMPAELGNVNKCVNGKSNLDASAIADHIIRIAGIRQRGDSLRLRIILKNGKEVSKSIPCGGLNKDDPVALEKMQNYINTDAGEWLAS